MITAILPSVAASAIILTSTFSAPKPPNPQIVFTQVLPEKNYVAHHVEESETLTFIAKSYFGDESYWTTIWNDNPWITDPNRLENNWLLKISIKRQEKPQELLPGLKTIFAQKLHKDVVEANMPDTFYAPPPLASPPTSYDDVYKQAGAQFGVPWQILYGIHITESGGRNGAITSGYGTGAQGPMQFMPGTFHSYAVKANGAGAPDINAANDAIFTAANFLAKHGSITAGLRAYGGNTAGVLALARARGFNQ